MRQDQLGSGRRRHDQLGSVRRRHGQLGPGKSRQDQLGPGRRRQDHLGPRNCQDQIEQTNKKLITVLYCRSIEDYSFIIGIILHNITLYNLFLQ